MNWIAQGAAKHDGRILASVLMLFVVAVIAGCWYFGWYPATIARIQKLEDRIWNLEVNNKITSEELDTLFRRTKDLHP